MPAAPCCRHVSGPIDVRRAQTIEQYKGNSGSKFTARVFQDLVGRHVVDDWEQYLDLMVDSIFLNGGRSCINASGIWASRHTQAIAAALPKLGDRIEAAADHSGLSGLHRPERSSGHLADDRGTSRRRRDARDRTLRPARRRERCAYLRPTIVHCASPDCEIARKSHVPFGHRRAVPGSELLAKIGTTLSAR